MCLTLVACSSKNVNNNAVNNDVTGVDDAVEEPLDEDYAPDVNDYYEDGYLEDYDDYYSDDNSGVIYDDFVD